MLIRHRWPFLLLLLVVLVFLLLFLANLNFVYSPRFNRAILICNNLFRQGLIGKDDCTQDATITEYIPHYFTIGISSLEEVDIGFTGIRREEIQTLRDCENRDEHILIRYHTGLTESALMGFCGSKLDNIIYED